MRTLLLRRRCAVLLFLLSSLTAFAAGPQRWSEAAANSWYDRQPWLVGSNYIPATAINQLEMWQADSFDPQRIDLELAWAQGLGMNTMRVFLHDLVWARDAAQYEARINTFLTLAAAHGIRPIFVLFDSCWSPDPKLGPQPPPRPGIHNSGWVQGPGARALADPAQYPRLKQYVQGVIGAFRNDDRVLAWDLWNEPDNVNAGSYAELEPTRKVNLVAELLPQVFAWARSVNPSQPLTSGVWQGRDWSKLNKLQPVSRMQLELSDIISFHSYGPADEFKKRVRSLRRYHRPVLCTEYMARPQKSTFEAILPVAKKYKVAAINWGLVLGKTQTRYPWDSWEKPYTEREPPVWFHDIFRPDGTPYRPEEVIFIRMMTGKAGVASSASTTQ